LRIRFAFSFFLIVKLISRFKFHSVGKEIRRESGNQFDDYYSRKPRKISLFRPPIGPEKRSDRFLEQVFVDNRQFF